MSLRNLRIKLDNDRRSYAKGQNVLIERERLPRGGWRHYEGHYLPKGSSSTQYATMGNGGGGYNGGGTTVGE